MIWTSNRDGGYKIVVDGDCTSGKISNGNNAIGVVTADIPITSTINVNDLSLSTNELKICVTDSRNGLVGQSTYNIFRDDEIPKVLFTVPDDNSTFVSLDANIIVQFNKMILLS